MQAGCFDFIWLTLCVVGRMLYGPSLCRSIAPRNLIFHFTTYSRCLVIVLVERLTVSQHEFVDCFSSVYILGNALEWYDELQWFPALAQAAIFLLYDPQDTDAQPLVVLT